MKLTLVSEKKQPLLGRRELFYKAEIEQGATPSKETFKKEIIAHTHAPEKLVVIHKIHTSFGSTTAHVDALIYDNEQSFTTFAVIHKKQKKGTGAASQQAALQQPAQQPAEK